jgi:hypothetical protein
VGDVAPRNHKVNEASSIADGPDSDGVFTLSRPDEGWPVGDYRVEFYIDETLAEAISLKIGK